jgi:hypothetical protein
VTVAVDTSVAVPLLVRIGLIGGIALVIYLFIALTHPQWF